MLYMIIERFRAGDPLPVYRRFRDHGRLAPDGLEYVASWVTDDLASCYQVMACEDPALLESWMGHWRDLVDFEVVPVRTSSETAEAVAPRLEAMAPAAAIPSATGRPVPGEYAEYAAGDIAAVPGDDAIEAVAGLEAQTLGIVRDLGEAVERGVTYATGKWTPKEVLGHLVDDERIFVYRLLCLARGEAAELPGFDENGYAAHGEFERRSLASLLAEYRAVRAATLALLRALPSSAWDRRGRVNGYACSVRGLAFHIAGHELHHIRVLRERYLPAARRAVPSISGANRAGP